MGNCFAKTSSKQRPATTSKRSHAHLATHQSDFSPLPSSSRQVAQAQFPSLVDLTQQAVNPCFVDLTPQASTTLCSCRGNRLDHYETVRRLCLSIPFESNMLEKHFLCQSCDLPLRRCDVITALSAEDLHAAEWKIAHILLRNNNASAARPRNNKRARPNSLDLRQVTEIVAAIDKLQTALGINDKGKEEFEAEISVPTLLTRSKSAAPVKSPPPTATPKVDAATARQQAACRSGANIAKAFMHTAADAMFPDHNPKGTGYAGSSRGGCSKEIEKARKKEKEADKEVESCLRAVLVRLQAAGGMSWDGSNEFSFLATAAILGSALGYILVRLLRNTSLMDIAQRQQLYVELLSLVQYMVKYPELKPLLARRLDQPTSKRLCTLNSAQSIFTALQDLERQCSVYQRTARNGVETEEEMASVQLALMVCGCYAELKTAIDSDVGVTPAALEEPQPQPSPAPGPSSSSRLIRALRPRLPTPKAKPAKQTAEELQAAAKAKQEELESRYKRNLELYRLEQWPLLEKNEWHFRSEAHKKGTGARKYYARLSKEVASLTSSLPLAWSTSVFLLCDEARMDVLRAMIIGPEGTPYENGIYIFDIYCPPDYPDKPPRVQFLTTGGGSVRFNPNLYESGKVCLSLLGTWQGPSWDPKTSTLLQVLVSIQSMILCDDPYFNEPGYERSRQTPYGQNKSNQYNANIQAANLRTALLPALQNPPACFQKVLRTHFHLKRDSILEMLDRWTKKTTSLSGHASKVREALKQYEQPPEVATNK